MCHRQFCKIISQNPEYVRNQCNDMESPLNFAIRNWMIKQKVDTVLIFFENITIE